MISHFQPFSPTKSLGPTTHVLSKYLVNFGLGWQQVERERYFWLTLDFNGTFKQAKVNIDKIINAEI